MSLDKLKALRTELEKHSMEASQLLTHSLQLREKEVGDGETYNGMIQVRSSSSSAPRAAANAVDAGSRYCGSQNEDDFFTQWSGEFAPFVGDGLDPEDEREHEFSEVDEGSQHDYHCTSCAFPLPKGTSDLVPCSSASVDYETSARPAAPRDTNPLHSAHPFLHSSHNSLDHPSSPVASYHPVDPHRDSLDTPHRDPGPARRSAHEVAAAPARPCLRGQKRARGRRDLGRAVEGWEGEGIRVGGKDLCWEEVGRQSF